MKKIILIMTLFMGATSWGSLKDIVEQVEDVQVHVLEDGREILSAAENGLTLYTFDNDEDGVSNCFDKCLRIWPVLATEATALPEPFSVHTRQDGTPQLVLDDRPLYFFVRDKAPGDIRGDGVGSVWHLVDLNIDDE